MFGMSMCKVLPVSKLCFSYLRETWEKKPILVQRNNPDYYKGLFSTAEFDRILREVRTINIQGLINPACICTFSAFIIRYWTVVLNITHQKLG